MTPNTINTPINDPLAMAENPQEIKYSNEYFGQVSLDVWFCVLEKGVGKVPFDPNTHSIDRRLTAITMGIIPVPASGLQFSVDRDYIAEFRPWNAITLPSLKALGVSVRELNDRYVRVKMTETGETYTNSQGETREKTAFEFLAIYDSLEACEADFTAKRGSSAQPNTSPQKSQAAPTAGNGNKDRDAALKFLEVAVKSTCQGLTDLDQAREAVAAQIAKMPLINKHFTVDSPETMNFMAEALAPF
ncbi:MAG: hypothetical protein BWX85_00012 [Chloroflexi bacterium ADurb.Bin120]|nr:MAG: hypothetical protein BWX85_00012 [Chloroflexi bacterium ADurb.Bin120]